MIALCGNKIDKKAEITRTESEHWQSQRGINIGLQTSAKTKENVEKLFLQLATEIDAFKGNFEQKRGDTFVVRYQTNE